MDGTIHLNELVNALISVMIIPILSVLTKYIITYLKKKTAEIENSTKNMELSKCIDLANEAISTCVVAVNQLYVESIKKNRSSLTEDEKKAAFFMAHERAKQMMGDRTVQILKSHYKDFDAWLEGRIEYYVNQYKNK